MIKLIALIGEAGSGKDTMLKYIQQITNGMFNEIVSCTTRPKRDYEVDGVSYHFLKGKDFLEKVENGEMLEHTAFNGWFYGTTKEALAQDKINIGVFNPSGIYDLLMHNDIDLQVFWIKSSEKTRLLRQLNREENPKVREIIRRYQTDLDDFCLLDFDYIEIDNEKEEDLRIGALQILDKIR